MTSNNTDIAIELRNAALAILKVRSAQLRVDRDTGVCSYEYADDDLRLCHQPSIAGTSMPSVVDIWIAGTSRPVFTIYWFAGGRFEVITHLAGLPWEDTLRYLAAMAPMDTTRGVKGVRS